ncbi:MAG TPA: hypothetical protein ENH90_01800 [bacterium]|nr:hypothetical protein [bacterium]
MSKKEELKKQLVLARVEIRDVKSGLAKRDQDLSNEVSDGWTEVWLKKVKDLRAALKRFQE